jgi:acyl-CoA reductase-like NAD-dependent aldehyde dehydrogenase
MPMFTLTIDGQGHCGAASLEIINPATEEHIGYAPAASHAELDAAVSAARRAYPGWKALPIEQRQAQVAAFGVLIMTHLDELKQLLTAEQGKPLADAEEDICRGAFFCTGSGELTPPIEVHEDSAERSATTYRVPLGVVAAISPWNVPVAISLMKVAPALVAGNTVVLKPSPLTPLTVLRIGELARDIFPPGVLNVISGDDDLGPLLTSHPGVDKISFTGSTATGRNVMQSAANTLKRITLELGGNDPAIVLPDADVSKVARQLFGAAFWNSGQICLATKRIYVHDDIYDDFAREIVQTAEGATIGNGAEPGINFGPLQNRRQYDRVRELIADCRTNGYRFLLGENSTVPDRGYFVPFTIIDNPPHTSRIVQEEQFGPVLPLLRFSSVDEAVTLANDSNYGLGASVWGPAPEAANVAERLEAGTVWVNEIFFMAPTQPFGGHKQSGIGVAGGLEGLLEYTNAKTVVTAKKF